MNFFNSEAYPPDRQLNAASTAIVVPARLASTRFPQKLLHPVAGKPLVLWTADQLRQEVPELPLYFAVDSPVLQQLLQEHGYRAILTPPLLRNGTERIAYVLDAIPQSQILNIQADEPLVTRRHILALCNALEGSGAPMATVGAPLENMSHWHNPHRVKVVRSRQGLALYFSRSPIPYVRDLPLEIAFQNHPNTFLLHLGLYAYQKTFLATYSELPEGPLEQLECLEQLRALENGFPIAVGLCDQPTQGIDHPDDLPAVETLLHNASMKSSSRAAFSQ